MGYQTINIRIYIYILYDTWSQQGHWVLCIATLFLELQITRSDSRPHIKWAVSLVIAYGHFNFPQVFVWVAFIV